MYSYYVAVDATGHHWPVAAKSSQEAAALRRRLLREWRARGGRRPRVTRAARWQALRLAADVGCPLADPAGHIIIGEEEVAAMVTAMDSRR